MDTMADAPPADVRPADATLADPRPARQRGWAAVLAGGRPGGTWRLRAVVSCVTVAVLLPLAFLIWRAAQVGWSQLSALLFRHLTLDLLWNTVRLTVAVAVACAAIGLAAAWCIERTDLPGRRVWAVLVVLPVAIPDFVVSFGWVSVAPWIHGFWGAFLVMTLAVYPLVYLPVAAALRGTDPAQEEVARSLGLSPLATFRQVTLRQVRPALLGGCMLVALTLLAEYGAFEILRYQTFTVEIFTEFQQGFNTAAAAALSLVVVGLGLLVLGGDALARGRGRLSRSDRNAARAARRHRLGRALPATLAGFGVLVALGLGVPVGTLLYWLLEGGHSTLPAAASLATATGYTVAYSALAGLFATAAALPVAVLAVRHPGRLGAVFERFNYVIQALPGLVVALALVFFTVRYAGFLYLHTPLLVACYSLMFFPLALVAVRNSVAQVPVRLEEVARSLGQSRLRVLVRVTLPLVAPGLAAAFSLVFLTTVTELTATLVLIPTGAATLATQFWSFTTNLSYGAAAPYAAVMVAIAAGPSYVLGRWFDRRPGAAVGRL
jgi:iron(III) transport system permease protein